MFIPEKTTEFEDWLIDALREYEDPSDVIVSVLSDPHGVIVAVRGGRRFLLKVEKISG